MSLSKEDEKYYKDVKVLEKYLTPIFIDYDPCCAKDIPFDEMARLSAKHNKDINYSDLIRRP